MANYELVQHLGQGAMGVVSLVRSRLTGRLCVVKETTVRRKGILEEAVLNRMAEVVAMAGCNHPHVIRHFESFMEGDVLFIIMEYADGGDLQQRLLPRHGQPAKRLSYDRILELFVQLVSAVAHLHDRGIIHRDLKPGNILFRKDGSLVLADLGLSTILAQSDDVAMHAVGTPFFMSPELCMGEPYGKPSDIWGLGMMLFVMVAMRPVWHGEDMASVLDSICNDPLLVFRGEYAALNPLLKRLLRRNPHHRPTVDEVLNDPLLRPILKRRASEAGSSSQSELTAMTGKERAFPALLEELRLITRLGSVASDSREGIRARNEWTKNLSNKALLDNFKRWLRTKQKNGHWRSFEMSSVPLLEPTERARPSALLVHMLTQSSVRRFMRHEVETGHAQPSSHKTGSAGVTHATGGGTRAPSSSRSSSGDSSDSDNSGRRRGGGSSSDSRTATATEEQASDTSSDSDSAPSEDAAMSASAARASISDSSLGAPRTGGSARERYLSIQRARVRDRTERLKTDAFFVFMEELCKNRPTRTGDICPKVLASFRLAKVASWRLPPEDIRTKTPMKKGRK